MKSENVQQQYLKLRQDVKHEAGKEKSQENKPDGNNPSDNEMNSNVEGAVR